MSSNQVYISLERLKELEFIEKNYSTIITNTASYIIASNLDTYSISTIQINVKNTLKAAEKKGT
jgi:hypothetical protein